MPPRGRPAARSAPCSSRPSYVPTLAPVQTASWSAGSNSTAGAARNTARGDYTGYHASRKAMTDMARSLQPRSAAGVPSLRTANATLASPAIWGRATRSGTRLHTTGLELTRSGGPGSLTPVPSAAVRGVLAATPPWTVLPSPSRPGPDWVKHPSHDPQQEPEQPCPTPTASSACAPSSPGPGLSRSTLYRKIAGGTFPTLASHLHPTAQAGASPRSTAGVADPVVVATAKKNRGRDEAESVERLPGGKPWLRDVDLDDRRAFTLYTVRIN